MAQRFNRFLLTALLGGRWAMAPFGVGLIVKLLLLPAELGRELAHAVTGFGAMGGPEVILAVLKIVDLVLVANLVLVITNAAVEILGPSSATGDEERPGWPGIMEFAELKPKLFASISAITAVDVLEGLVNIDSVDKSVLVWETAILLAFVASGVLLAPMDRLEDGHG